jgi:hypothetical protein
MFLLINPSEWGRYKEKVEQALAQSAEQRRRLDRLILVLVGGLFAVGAAIIGAVLAAVLGG